MNTGLLYVNPKYGRSGFPVYKNGVLVGFKGYKGKRVPFARFLKYHSGPGRGSKFVERTIRIYFIFFFIKVILKFKCSGMNQVQIIVEQGL